MRLPTRAQCTGASWPEFGTESVCDGGSRLSRLTTRLDTAGTQAHPSLESLEWKRESMERESGKSGRNYWGIRKVSLTITFANSRLSTRIKVTKLVPKIESKKSLLANLAKPHRKLIGVKEKFVRGGDNSEPRHTLKLPRRGTRNGAHE